MKTDPKATIMVDPNMGKLKKYPMNPDPSIQRIRTLVTIALEETAKPFDKSDGAAWARLEGSCEYALKEIAKELGVTV